MRHFATMLTVTLIALLTLTSGVSGETSIELQFDQTPLREAVRQIDEADTTLVLAGWKSLAAAGIESDQRVTGQIDATTVEQALRDLVSLAGLNEQVRIEPTAAFVRITAIAPGEAVKAKTKSALHEQYATPAPARRDQPAFDAYVRRGEQMSIDHQLDSVMKLRALEDRILQQRAGGLSDFQRAVIGASTRPGPAGGIVTQRPLITGGPVVGGGGAIGFDPTVTVVNDGTAFAGGGRVTGGGAYVTLNAGASLVGNVEFRRVPIFFDTGRGRPSRGFIELPTTSLVKSRSTVFAPATPVSRQPLIYRPAKLR